jgi:putative hemolysin
MTGSVVVVAVLLLGSAALAAAGAAVFQVGASHVRTLHDEGFRGAAELVRLRSRPERTRAGIRVVDTALKLAAVGIVGVTGEAEWGSIVSIGTLAGAVVGVLVVGDLLPRSIAARHPIRIALLSSPFLVAMSRWLSVLGAPLARVEEALIGREESEVTVEERELRELQELGREEGVLEEHESILVERAFRLDELTAYDVMTPRVDVFAWKDSMTLQEAVDQLDGVPYSRIPVYGDSVDDVTGILHVREVYQAFVQGPADRTLSSLAREPFFVPGSLSLSRLLRDFQSRRIHIGLVADEFGGIDGLVTLEDVLEELVGEIVDETDLEETDLIRISDTEALADAAVDLRDINHVFDVDLPTLEHRSLNGFILEELGYVPSVGEALERSGVRIEVVEATDTQVLRARLTRTRASDTGRSGGG